MKSHLSCVLPIYVTYTTLLGRAKCGVFLSFYFLIYKYYMYNTYKGNIYS